MFFWCFILAFSKTQTSLEHKLKVSTFF